MDDRYTSGAYARANPGWHAEDAAHKARAVLALLDGLGWHPDHVLDVGCGTGDVLRALKATLDARGRTGVTYEGRDPAAPLGAGDARVRLVRDALAAAPPRADVTLCLDVAEHVTDPRALLVELARTAPRLVLRLPLDRSLLDTLRPHRLREARERYGHLHAWTRGEALAVVRSAGLRIVHARFDRVPPALDTPRRRVVDAVRRSAVALAPRAAVRLLGGYSLLVAAVPVAASHAAR